MTNTGKNALPRMKVLIAAARRPLNNSLQGLPMLNQDAIHAIILQAAEHQRRARPDEQLTVGLDTRLFGADAALIRCRWCR
jgi:uncharacterized transporter YbjL